MSDYIFLTHNDAVADEKAWEPYIRGLQQRGCFQGGSGRPPGGRVLARLDDDMDDGLGEAAPRPSDQVARQPVQGPIRPSRDHDLLGPKPVERVGNGLQRIGVADLPVGFDPRGADALELSGEAKSGASTCLVLVR